MGVPLAQIFGSELLTVSLVISSMEEGYWVGFDILGLAVKEVDWVGFEMDGLVV